MLSIPSPRTGMASWRTPAWSNDVERSTGFNAGRDGTTVPTPRPPGPLHAQDRMQVQVARASDELLLRAARGTILQQSKLLLQ